MAVYHTALPAGLSIAQAHRLYNELIDTLEKEAAVYRQKRMKPEAVAAAAQAQKVRISYRHFNARLARIERDTARDATVAIRQQIKATKIRAASVTGQMAKHVRCAPLIIPGARSLHTGSVGIVDEQHMDKAVNPLSPDAGSYWRAQEYGSSAHLGREIWGVFTDKGFGNPEPPRSQYAGGGGPGKRFVTTRMGREAFGGLGFSGGLGKRGGSGGGRGIIQNPLKPRHFIRDGTSIAEADWRKDMARAEAESLASLTRLMGRSRPSGPSRARSLGRQLPRRRP